MAKKSVSDQAIGFTLKVEAGSSIEDLKDLDSQYKRLERTIKQTAESFVDETNRMLNSASKLKEAGLSGTQFGASTGMGGESESSGGSTTTTGATMEAGATISIVALTALVKSVIKVLKSQGYKVDSLKEAASVTADKLSSSDYEGIEKEDLQSAFSKALALRSGAGGIGVDTKLDNFIEDLDSVLKQNHPESFMESIVGSGGRDSSYAPEKVDELITELNTLAKGMLKQETEQTVSGPGNIGTGGKAAAEVTKAKSGISTNMERVQAKYALKDMLGSSETGDTAGKAATITKSVVTGDSKGLADSFGKVGVGKLGELAAYGAAMAYVASEFEDFQEAFIKFSKATGVVEEDLGKITDQMMKTSLATGKSIEEVATAYTVLYQSGVGANEGLGELAETSVKVATIFGETNADVAAFSATLSKGLRMSVKDTEKVMASMIGVAARGGVTFEQMKDNIEDVAEALKPLQGLMQDALKPDILNKVAAATATFSKNLDDTSAAADLVKAALSSYSNEQAGLMMLMRKGGADIASNMEMQQMAAENTEEIWVYASRGIKDFQKQYAHMGAGWAKFAAQVYGISEQQVLSLSRMTEEELQKNIDAGKKAQTASAKAINDRYAEAISTLSELKNQITNVFKVFLAYVGAPIFKVLLLTFKGINAVLRAIPAPMMKMVGLAVGLGLAMKGVYATAKAIKALELGSLFTGMLKWKGAAAAATTTGAGEVAKTGLKAGIAATVVDKVKGVAEKAKGFSKNIVTNLKSKVPVKTGLMGVPREPVLIARGTNQAQILRNVGKEIGNLTKGQMLRGLIKTNVVITSIVHVVTTMFKAMHKMFTLKGIDDKLTPSVEALYATFNQFKGIADNFNKMLDSIFSGDFTGAEGLVESIVSSFETALEELPDKISKFFEELPEYITKVFEDEDSIVESLGSFFEKAFEAIFSSSDLVYAITKGLARSFLAIGKFINKMMFDTMVKVGKNLVASIINVIIQTLFDMARAIVKQLSKIPGLGFLLKDHDQGLKLLEESTGMDIASSTKASREATAATEATPTGLLKTGMSFAGGVTDLAKEKLLKAGKTETPEEGEAAVRTAEASERQEELLTQMVAYMQQMSKNGNGKMTKGINLRSATDMDLAQASPGG